MSPRVARAGLVLVVALAAVLTLGPTPVGGLDDWHRLLVRVSLRLGAPEWVPSRGEAEALANVVMFVPLGLLLTAALPQVRRHLLVLGLVGLSAAVELVQLVLLSNRQASLRDVALNGVGGLLGVLAGHLWVGLRGRSCDT